MLANKNSRFYTFLIKNNDITFSLLIFIVMSLILINPTYFTAGTVNGIKLFFYSVFPGLFPFMFLTKLLTEIGFIFKISKKLDNIAYKLFGTPGVSFYAFLMSIISGYPIGAKIISDLYDKNFITEIDANKMCTFCTTSGPIFVIGTVGNIMFGSQKIGIIIYVSHIFSTIVLALLFKILSKKQITSSHYQKEILYAKNSGAIVADCVSQTINSLLIVGAYITIFYLLADILTVLKIFDCLKMIFFHIFSLLHISTELSSGTVYGILEITRGCKTLSSFHTYQSVALCSALISFSGISIIFQSMVFLKNAKIKMHDFIFIKIIHSILAYLTCILIIFIFRIFI